MTKLDRSGWESGPWDDEPDELEWTDPKTDLPCWIRRGPVGSLCGYVRVPEGHPWHGGDYDNYIFDCDVHGGLTFGGCFDSKPGVFWFGFDCAHGGDLCPGLESWIPHTGDKYRNIEYVKAECTRLAEQIDKAWPPMQQLAMRGRK